MNKIFLITIAFTVLATLLSAFSCKPEVTSQVNVPSSKAEMKPQGPILAENSTIEPPVSKPSLGQSNDAQQVTEGSNIDLQYLIHSNPADVDNSRLPITPIRELHTTGNPPPVDILQYRLSIEGLVDHSLSLNYLTLMTYPKVTETVLLICPEFFVDNAVWTGIRATTILQSAGIKPGANKITFIGLDGYRQTLSLEEAQQEDVFLAYMVDGETLPIEHGFPVRLVVKGRYGNIWVKWVQRIEVK